MSKGSGFWWVVGGVLTLAVVAVVLTKANTAPVVTAGGSAFSGLIKAATGG